MNYLDKLIGDIECHDVAGIRECFANGINPNDLYKDEPLIHELVSEYARTPRFAECVQVFIDAGLQMLQRELLAVLANDAELLRTELEARPWVVNERYTLRCAYTPLFQATLLHICAEFNHLDCAELLVQHGADVNAEAGTDEHGFGGQTPIFHTVNQNGNNSKEMMEFLLQQQAELKITVPGLIWGKTYPWETLVPAVNPVSYAAMGMLPLMHRNEQTIAGVVKQLMKAAYAIDYTSENIPNAYLKP